jgi:hypothetical protein
MARGLTRTGRIDTPECRAIALVSKPASVADGARARRHQPAARRRPGGVRTALNRP